MPQDTAAIVTYTDPDVIQSSGIAAGTTKILAFNVTLNFRRMKNGQLDGESDITTARYMPGRSIFGRVQHVSGRVEELTWKKLFGKEIMLPGSRFRVAKFIIKHKEPVYDTERFTS